MAKRLDNLNTYKLETEKAIYAVTLIYRGQQKYIAQIITLIAKEDHEELNRKQSFYTAHYRFDGAFSTPQEAVSYIVGKFEERE